VVSAAVAIGTSVTTLLSYTTGVFVKPPVDDFGWADHEVLVSYSIVLFGASALSPLIGRLSDRIGARRVAIGSVVGLAMSWFLLALTTGSLRVFYVCFAMMAIVGTVRGDVCLRCALVPDTGAVSNIHGTAGVPMTTESILIPPP
jgi:MFS family permease